MGELGTILLLIFTDLYSIWLGSYGIYRHITKDQKSPFLFDYDFVNNDEKLTFLDNHQAVDKISCSMGCDFLTLWVHDSTHR